MKKGLIAVLTVALVAVIGIAVIFFVNSGDNIDTAGLTAFAVQADEAMTRRASSDEEGQVAILKSILDDAVSVADKPGHALEYARLTLTVGNQQSEPYPLFTDGEYTLIRMDEAYYQLDETALLGLFGSLEGFYLYGVVPEASLSTADASAPMLVAENGYEYLQLDGNYYPADRSTGSEPRFTVSTRDIPVPEFDAEPATVTVTVFKDSDGEVLWSGDMTEAGDYLLPRGDRYVIQYLAEYDGDYYRGNVLYQVQLEVEETAVRFTVEGGSTPGEAVVIRATGVDSAGAITVASDVGVTPRFFPDGQGGFIALMPVSYNHAPGTYSLTLSAAGETQQFSIVVGYREFQVQHLTVDEATTEETLNSQYANNEFEQHIAPLRQVADNTRHWQGRFIMPVEDYSRITTGFGAIRYTNGSSVASRHGALDIAQPTGTRVGASNSGRVLYAGYLQLTGNTVLIEHGYGLKTWYYHMDSLDVETGDMVEKNQKIGEVGSTGFSSGPHLHYGMSVNNVFINPYTAINTDLFD